MLKFFIILQLFSALNIAGASVNSKHGMAEETNADFIGSPRTSRQANDSKDPYTIVKEKCIEYASVRYTTNLNNGSKNIGTRNLECVISKPFSVAAEPAKLKEFPHMALIGYKYQNDETQTTQWLCGGTLISDRYVLTAQTCNAYETYVPKWVRLGELIVRNDTDSAEYKDYRIAQRIIHPQINNPRLLRRHNIMLLKLSEPVTFTAHIRPVCLYPSQDTARLYNESAIISGWGRSGPDEQESDELYRMKVNFTQDRECTSYYAEDEHLPNGFDSSCMICAGGINAIESCRVDIGGPLQIPAKDWPCMYWQVGIFSHGPGVCHFSGLPIIIFTKVSRYIPWIQSIVWP